MTTCTIKWCGKNSKTANNKTDGITFHKGCMLWKGDRSPACRAVMMAIDAMELSLTEVDVDMDKSEQKCPDISMSRHMFVPSISVSLSASTQLYPADPGARSLVDQQMFYNCGVLYPRYRSATDPILFDNESFVMPQQVNNIECAYVDLETFLGRRDWFGGSWLTLGDITIGATVSTLHCLVPIDSQRFPLLSTWLCRFSDQSFYLTANKRGLSEFIRKFGFPVFVISGLSRDTIRLHDGNKLCKVIKDKKAEQVAVQLMKTIILNVKEVPRDEDISPPRKANVKPKTFNFIIVLFH